MIRSLVADKPKQWDQVLPQAEFVYNSMVNRSTCLSSFQIVYTRDLNYIVDLINLPPTKCRVVESLAEQIS